MQGHDIALVAGQFAKVGSSKSAGMNFRLTPEMLEKFTSTGKRRFGRKVKEFVPTDGFKAVFNEVGVRLKQQQTTNQFDPEQMWSYVCGLFLGARRKIATAGVVAQDDVGSACRRIRCWDLASVRPGRHGSWKSIPMFSTTLATMLCGAR